MNDFIDLRRIIFLLLRYWAFILIFTIVAGTIGFFVSLLRTPVYTSNTTIAIGSFIEAEDIGTYFPEAGDKLTLTYLNIAKREPVMSGVVSELEMDVSWRQLRETVEVRNIPNTQLIEISVKNSDQNLANSIANEVVNQLRKFAPDTQFNSDEGADSGEIGFVSPNENKISVIERASINPDATTPSVSLNTVISTFLGLMASVIVVLILNMLNPDQSEPNLNLGEWTPIETFSSSRDEQTDQKQLKPTNESAG